ncbi:MAG: hypothetical protein LBH14_07340 [Desulfobulbaceae bacterium]|jgi:hypothetical protein|nr:hypothetical protein [Desulfobulbaceae bacterium]
MVFPQKPPILICDDPITMFGPAGAQRFIAGNLGKVQDKTVIIIDRRPANPA